jgi:hypothetical protein
MLWGYVTIGCVLLLAIVFIVASVLLAIREKNRIEP